jgi:hypothetical protein
MVMNRPAGHPQPPAPRQQFAAGVGSRTRSTRKSSIGVAIRAVATSGEKRHHHSLTGRQVIDAVADPDDASRSLVTEQHRHRTGPDPVDDRQVGVAQTGRLDPDQHFTGAWLLELQLDNAQRLRLGVGAWSPWLLEYRTDDLHSNSPFAVARLRRATRRRTCVVAQALPREAAAGRPGGYRMLAAPSKDDKDEPWQKCPSQQAAHADLQGRGRGGACESVRLVSDCRLHRDEPAQRLPRRDDGNRLSGRSNRHRQESSGGRPGGQRQMRALRRRRHEAAVRHRRR